MTYGGFVTPYNVLASRIVTVSLLTVNGKARTMPVPATVAGLLVELGVPGTVAVERNGHVVPRARHVETALLAGDKIEVVAFVGGG